MNELRDKHERAIDDILECFAEYGDHDRSAMAYVLDQHFPDAAIATVMEATGWQDIATAPRVETYEWLLGTDGSIVKPMMWAVECDDDKYTGWCGATYTDGGMPYHDHVELGFQPTRWKPLDPPPPFEGTKT